MNHHRLDGLVAATYTPLNDDGLLNLNAIPSMAQYLMDQNIKGLYVCGSTGEGMSLTTEERKRVAEAYVSAAKRQVPVVVQVGHNSVAEAQSLAKHAAEVGADIISATCPSYFKVNDIPTLIDCMAEVAAGAPQLPFYYYHIPALTGSGISMPDFLTQASARIPNLAGLKYTDTKLFEFQECIELDNGRFDVVWGCDEMLLGALATGAKAAIGSTYNVAGPLYQQLIEAFHSGDLAEARRLQANSIKMIRTLCEYPFHAAMKALLDMQGLAVGGCRLPQGKLSSTESNQLEEKLNTIGFFEWNQS